MSSAVSSCAYQDSEYKFDIFGHCDNLRLAICSEAQSLNSVELWQWIAADKMQVQSCEKWRARSAEYVSSEEGITYFCFLFSS